MRRLCLCLVVPLFLLFAQHAAVRHELGHLTLHADATVPKKGAPCEAPCETCVAFAHFAGAVRAHVPALPPAPLGRSESPTLVVAWLAAPSPRPRSRSPPGPL